MECLNGSAAVMHMLVGTAAPLGALTFEGPGQAHRLSGVLGDDVIGLAGDVIIELIVE